MTQEIQEYRLLGHNKSEKYILLASQKCLSSAWIKRFTVIANQYGYKTVALPSPEGFVDVGTNETIQLPLDPLEWLKIIACSDGYIGGRFHPLVICMSAGVPVLSIDKYHKLPWQCRKSKSWLLLHKFNLNKLCLGRWAHFLITPHWP